jgi:hypothetical protein
MSKTASQDGRSEKKQWVKKRGLEKTRFEGQLSEFTYKCMLEPVRDSFFAAVGLGLLESLVRMKSSGFLADSAWKNVMVRLSLAEQIAAELAVADTFASFKEFIIRLKAQSRAEARQSIDIIFSSHSSNIDFIMGIKLLVCACTGREYGIVFSGGYSVDLILKELSEKLSVHFVHIFLDQFTLYSAKNIGPLIFLYSFKEQFGVAYHSVTKLFDETADPGYIDLRSYPFLHNPAKQFSPKPLQETGNTANLLVECLEIVSGSAKEMPTRNKAELFKHVRALKSLMPEASARLVSVCSEIASNCGHDMIEFTPMCLQSHCTFCLLDLISVAQDDDVLCPCGVPLDYSDIEKLTVHEEDERSPRVMKSNSNSPGRAIPKVSKKKSRRSTKPSMSQALNRLPMIRSKVLCAVCRRSMESEEFGGEKCKGHSVCLECRVKSSKSGKASCQICGRKYGKGEVGVFRMRTGSVDFRTTLIDTRSFIDSL